LLYPDYISKFEKFRIQELIKVTCKIDEEDEKLVKKIIGHSDIHEAGDIFYKPDNNVCRKLTSLQKILNLG